MTDEQLLATRFEKSFQIGKVTVDYKKLLAENYGIRSDNERTDGARFKVIVEGGVLYIQPIDSFESVFELSKEMVTDVSLISILDPFLFDQHKDIVNALFEVYHDLSEQYLLKHSMPIVTLS
jgi:polyphosphate kinase